MAKFPSSEWALTFMEKLNTDEQYARLAQHWEGDFYYVIEPSGNLTERMVLYFDFWHGKCRAAFVENDPTARKPAFVLKAPYENFKRVLTGEMHPMTALMTGKLHVQGNLAMLMRSVPIVLDFVRCAVEVTDSFV